MCSLILSVILLMLNRGLFLGRCQKSMIEPSAKLVNGKWYLVFLVFACESLKSVRFAITNAKSVENVLVFTVTCNVN